jgi:hypothetical protein
VQTAVRTLGARRAALLDLAAVPVSLPVSLAVPLASPAPAVLAVNDLGQVIASLQTWIMGLLAAVATLFLVVGGLRYVLAAGDPSEIERAKGALKSAAVGYALAVLAPVLMTALRQILGV